jgi:hypothetical protein
MGDSVTTTMDAARGMNRRTLLRAGAATAWSVPLVQAATAAPAFAVSGPAKLTVAPVEGPGVARANGVYTIKLTVTNSGGAATHGLTATVASSPAPLGSPSTPTTGPLDMPSVGWSVSGPPWAADQQIPAGGSKSFNMTFSVPKGHVGKANTVTVTFTSSPPDVPPTTGTFSQSFPQTTA